MIRYEFSAEASRIVRSEIRELLAWSRRSDTISFGGGLPDPSLFPVGDLERICAEVLGRKGYLALQYGPTPGEPEALESFSRYMGVHGDRAEPGSLCVVSSSQQALDLLTLLFLYVIPDFQNPSGVTLSRAGREAGWAPARAEA